MPKYSLKEIAEISGGTVVGDGSLVVNDICPSDAPRGGALCVAWENGAIAKVPADIAILGPLGALAGRSGIEHENPRMALSKLLFRFDRRERVTPGVVHPSAAIHSGSSVAATAAIGPCCVVSSGAVIGDGAVLQANVFVGKDVVVGENSRLEAGVVIQDLVQLGRNVIVHSGTIIGCDGFGFVPDAEGRWNKMPQIGTVIIEDDVEIGTNCTIDRATFGETRIGRGTKLGSLIHVAHNCHVGEDCVMTGFVGIAGSSKIGNRVILAGQAGVADHVTVGNGVTVAGRAGITKDVADGQTVAGYPAQEHRTENRMQAALRRLPDYMERLRELEKKVAALMPGQEKDAAD